MLNLEKIDFKNYDTKEIEMPKVEKRRKETELTEFEDQNLKQNILRGWEFLKKTHILKPGECCSVRATTYKLFKDDLGAVNHECVIYNFSDEEFEKYYKFIVSYISYKRVYNFYFNIFKISISQGKERVKERGHGFMAAKSTTTATNILSLDFDDITHNEYLELKEDLINRGIQTLDIFSGHGYHIHILLNEDSEDEDILKKMIRIFKSLGYNPDPQCCDCGRVLRIPFLYNCKTKYSTARLSEIIDGEYNCKKYSVSEIFKKLGYDYDTFSIEESRRERKTKRTEKNQNTAEHEPSEIFFRDINIEKVYGIDVSKLPTGIMNMMKGFVKGYANLQMMILTLYFKNRGYLVEDIKELLKITEKINGNKWNNWDLESEIKRIYNNYDYVSKFVLEELEPKFGKLIINYNEFTKVPICENAKQAELYIFLLKNGSCRKKDILKGLNYSNNKLDRIMKENNLVTLENRIYSINSNNLDKYILLKSEELENLFSLNYKEIAVYTYLKYRIGIKKSIKVSILTIKDNIDLSENTISNTIKSLEKKKFIKVERYKYGEHEPDNFYRDMNKYTILK